MAGLLFFNRGPAFYWNQSPISSQQFCQFEQLAPQIQEEKEGRYSGIAETITDEERALSALLIYHEARSESEACQKACYEVVLNRVLDGRYPGTVKEVINEKGQFSSKSLLITEPIREPACLAEAFDVVNEVLYETEYQLDEEYIFFAAKKVNGKEFIQIDRTYFSK